MRLGVGVSSSAGVGVGEDFFLLRFGCVLVRRGRCGILRLGRRLCLRFGRSARARCRRGLFFCGCFRAAAGSASASAWRKLSWIFSPNDFFRARRRQRREHDNAKAAPDISLGLHGIPQLNRRPTHKGQDAISCRIALFILIPASRFSSGKFSLGECARQSGRASPRSNVSTPRMSRNCETIGMLPPSRMSATSLPNACFSAVCAASPKAGMRIGQIPRAAVAIDDFHRHAGRQMFFQMLVRPVSKFPRHPDSGTRRKVSFAMAWLAITVFVPFPW